VEFHPNGTCIAAGGTDNTVKVDLSFRFYSLNFLGLQGDIISFSEDVLMSTKFAK